MITKALMLKNRVLRQDEIARMLSQNGTTVSKIQRPGGINWLESDFDSTQFDNSRPLWVCLIDDVALVTSEPDGGVNLEDTILGQVNEQCILIDLATAKAETQAIKLIFRNESQGVIQDEHSFCPRDVLSLDQMAQLMTLEGAPFPRITLECVGMGNYQLFGHVTDETGGNDTLHLCNNLGNHVSDPILPEEVGQVKFISTCLMIYPIFVELI